MSEIPGFESALSSFQALLVKSGIDGNVIWVFAEDVVLVRGRFLVRRSIDPSNLSAVRARFELARKAELGVEFGVLCRSGPSDVACYVWMPANDVEASMALMSQNSVKMAIPKSLAKGLRVPRLLVSIIRRSFADDNRFKTSMRLLSKR